MSLPSSRRSRLGASAVVVAASALVLAGCSTGDDAPAASDSGESASHGDVTLQLSWILNEEFAGEYVADSEGYYEEAGFDSVNLVPGPSTGVAELLGGNADIALSDSVAVGTAIANESAPLKIIGATFQANPFTVLSLADGGNIATPEDLVGKKIGVQDSNTSLFNALLAANDIDPADVEVVPVQYDPAPLVNGEVDGFIAYLTNEAIAVDLMGIETTNLAFADNNLPFVAETVTVTQEKIDSDRELLKDFLVAEIKGWTDAVADPQLGADLAIETYGADLGLDPEKTLAGSEAQNALVVSDDTEENGLFTISEALQEETIASLAGAGIEVTADDLFDLSLLDEVYEENPDLVDYAG
ncbi:ABC transporter substrate-binding protein [Microbacterium betulae]|uniref:Thiamine pyrimidine synthase n=1 Tax=Microbacterium betulae TaxID=2981139 RepID=A0AA97I4M3_9MICO|nr:ABC transporter substrate-binding protein [Microbacterium sp. AB]WOF22756.1 ABC transporter substrate-binding protein [Microbacterium sp. AB]